MKIKSLEYVEYQIEKSKNTLEDAQLLFINDRLTSAINRIYYSCFYSVSAFANINEFFTSKHTGMKSYFDREIANKQLVELDMKKFYSIIYDKRYSGDYKKYDFNRDDVGLWLNEAKKFTNKINTMTIKIIQDEKMKNQNNFIIDR